jgi:hypothetical protein
MIQNNQEINKLTEKTAKKRSKSKKNKILIAHDNSTPGHTTKAHKFAERVAKDPNYTTIVDKEVWKPGEKTSATETDRREKEMVRQVDTVARVIPPSSKTKQKRHEGAQREVRKAINQRKDVIEIYENGARDSPNRSLSEKNYKNRVAIHLKPRQKLETGLKKGMEDLKKKKQQIQRKKNPRSKPTNSTQKKSKIKPKTNSQAKKSQSKSIAKKKARKSTKKSPSKSPAKKTTRKPKANSQAKKSQSKSIAKKKARKSTKKSPSKSPAKKTTRKPKTNSQAQKSTKKSQSKSIAKKKARKSKPNSQARKSTKKSPSKSPAKKTARKPKTKSRRRK